MRELNIQFLEQYKRLDKLCKEMYSSSEGVSSYIQDMERTSYTERIAVNSWDAHYKQLKQARWKRNQLAHEIEIDTNFCEQFDIDWVKQFYDSILNGTDPLTRVYKIKHATTQNRTIISKMSSENKAPQSNVSKEKNRKSFWSKILSKIKNWFS